MCGTCGRVYSHLSSLLLHKKLHEGRTTCSLCGSVYGRVSILRNHLQRVHNLSKADARAMALGSLPPSEFRSATQEFSQRSYLGYEVEQGPSAKPAAKSAESL